MSADRIKQIAERLIEAVAYPHDWSESTAERILREELKGWADPQASPAARKPYCPHCGCCHFPGENTLCNDGASPAASPQTEYEEKCLCPCEDKGGCIACDAGNHDYHSVPRQPFYYKHGAEGAPEPYEFNYAIANSDPDYEGEPAPQLPATLTPRGEPTVESARDFREKVRDNYVLRIVGAGLDTRAEYDEPAIMAAFASRMVESSEQIRFAEKKILIAEIEAHTATKAKLQSAESAAAQARKEWEIALEAERKNCEKSLLALAGAHYPTPVEGYGTNSSWAISDLCRAVKELPAEARSKAFAECAEIARSIKGDEVACPETNAALERAASAIQQAGGLRAARERK